jgi:hypothetical protein
VLEKEGYHLATRRVEIEMGKELPVEVELRPLPEPCPPPEQCPKPKPCPERKLVDAENLHIHLGMPLAIGVTNDRPVTAGTGVQLHGSLRRFVFGGTFIAFPMPEQAVAATASSAGTGSTDGEDQGRVSLRWLLFLIEGGYILPFEQFYVMLAGGVGVSADRLVPVDKEAFENPRVIEKFGVAWALGGGVESMLTRWLSVGLHGRVGAIHGKRAAKDNPGEPDADDPFALFTLWGSLTLHI